MSHRYHVHQQVRLRRTGAFDGRGGSGGTYEVIRLMPADQTGEVSYRIRSSTAGERAVKESEITAQLASV